MEEEKLEEINMEEEKKDDISLESDKLLHSMTKEEIIEAQKELLNTLNPSLIEKLKQRGISKK
jgi:hypothetical protein